MKKHFPIWVLVILGIFIFLFNLLATYWHLYFLIWWLDIPVHIFSGMWIALLSLSFYYRSNHTPHKEHSTLFVFVMAASISLVIGLAWEVYEFVIDRAMNANDIQLSDTLKDLCDDLLGGILATWIFVRNGYNKQI